MRLCVSNIAWKAEQEPEALELLLSLGVNCLEVAPTRWWPDLSSVDSEQILRVQEQWSKLGFTAVGFQAILFGRPDWSIFDDLTRDASLRYLQAVISLGFRMGISAIVFGAPKNRVRGSRSHEQAHEEAVSFFRVIGQTAFECGIRFCFEPNPVSYGGDFGCTMEESMTLVEGVDSPGFWLNLDSGAIALNGENPHEVVERARGRIGHVHISEPWLAGFSRPTAPHRELASALERVGYDGIVSVEMRASENGLDGVRQAVEFVKSVYPC